MDFELDIDTAGSFELISYNTWGAEEEACICIPPLRTSQNKLRDTKSTK